MLGGKMVSFKKLAKKVKVISKRDSCCEVSLSQHECLLGEIEEVAELATTPTGFFALYVGEEKERFVVPTGFLSHPLFKMLLDKAYTDHHLGFDQMNRLVIPCSVSTFQEVVNAVGCCNGKFDFGQLVEEFL